YGATSGPAGGSGSRPAAATTIRSTSSARISTARAAITFVFPGVEPIPRTASRPAERKSVSSSSCSSVTWKSPPPVAFPPPCRSATSRAPASFTSRTRMRSTPSCSASVATTAGPMMPAAPTTATVPTALGGDGLAGARLRHLDPRLVEHGVEDVVDEVEVVARRHERRRELDDRVAAVVSAADQAGVVQPPRQEPAQEVLRLGVGERLLRLLVLHELERHEVPGAAHVADDRLLAQLAEDAAEVVLVLAHVLDHALALHHLEVLERH